MRMFGSVLIMTGHPIGPRGVASKLKGPRKCSHADISGETVDFWRRLSVSSVCGRSLSQRKLGNESEIPARIVKNEL